MADDKPRRGRPRHNPEKLARWQPPQGWVRVVAWVSPEERRALKRAAVEVDASVADLIRGMATALDQKTLPVEGVLHSIRLGLNVMEKIPTLFDRDESFRVTPKVREGCEWVFNGEGVATEKLDGSNVRLTIRHGLLVRLEKRRNPTKRQKQLGVKDGWYMDADKNDPGDRYLFEAAEQTDVSEWPDGEHPCEALGPKIQGNPLELESHICVPFNLVAPTFDEVPRSFDGIRTYLESLESKYAPNHLAEGIVFHHPDGRRAKIKRIDFKGQF